MIIEKNNIIISYHKDRYNNYIEERIDKNSLSINEKDRRRKLSFIIKMKELEMIEEDRYNRMNICPCCMMVRARNGSCGC